MTFLFLIQADTDAESFSPELKADRDKNLRPRTDDSEGSGHQVSKTGSFEQSGADAYYVCHNIARRGRSGPLNITGIDLYLKILH